MLQVVNRWQVDVTLSDGSKVRVWISGHHITNVLGTLGGMWFSNDMEISVTSVHVHASTDLRQPVVTTGTVTSAPYARPSA